MASSTPTQPYELIRPDAPAREEPQAERTPKPMSRLFQLCAAVGCFIFGVALIANTQLACDGTWFWYAVLHHGGKHLYSDMHLVLQPLAVLETEWWMGLAGKGWIVSKVPALLHLLAFVAGIALLCAKSGWSDAQKTVLLLSTFFVGVHFEAYRFDDFHVMTDVCFLFAILLLLELRDGKDGKDAKWNGAIAVALGVLSGLAIMTRLTDGAALLFSAALALGYMANGRRLKLLAGFFVSTVLVVITVVKLTGDSFRDYAAYSILGAAGAKGGTSHVLARPFLLVQNTLTFLVTRPSVGPSPLRVIALCALVAACWAFFVKPFSKSQTQASGIKAVIGLALVAASLYLLVDPVQSGSVIVMLSAVWVLAAYGVVLFVAYKIAARWLGVGRGTAPDRKQILIVLPFMMLVSGALSSFGYHFGLYTPVAVFAAILPVCFPDVFTRHWLKSCFLVIVGLMAVAGAYYKVVNPVSWNNYRTFPMFSERLIVRHPQYGPMVIDKQLNSLITPVCADVNSGGKSELLSIPYSFANYYCDVPPWQGFVQTFFDTSGKDVIDDMISKLSTSPPRWVYYQRQINVLVQHEKAFNTERLPHRDLDEFIVNKINSRQWLLVDRAQDTNGNDWLLMRTD